MFAIASPAINSVALPASPAVTSAPAADAASTRQPPTASGVSAETTDTAPATVSTSAITAAPEENSGPSTPFLTQLISQNASVEEDSQIGLSSSFAHFLPAPQYNQLVGYSIVRYRPSDAGLPSSYYASLPADTSDDSGTGVQITGVYGAYSTTQVRNQSNLSHSEPQVSTAG